VLAATAKFHGLWVGSLIALTLAIRLITPAGFMPVFEHGAVAIVACPDFGPAPNAPGTHQHGGAKHGSSCPYAAAAPFGAFGGAAGLALETIVFALVPEPHRSSSFLIRDGSHDRPPLRGPPPQA
jgi:hypothetical protein